MKVTDIMTRQVHTIAPDKTLVECAEVLNRNKVNGAVVVDNQKVVGVITKADIFRSILPSYTDYMEDPGHVTRLEFLEERIDRLNEVRVMSVMSGMPITIESDSPVVKAGSLMIARRVKQLPVVDSGRLVGIVTLTDVVNFLRKKLHKEPGWRS
jgi:CBS domain-containing protein